MRTLLIAGFLLIGTLVKAQISPDNLSSSPSGYSISGIVMDSATGQPMEYVTISLLKTKDLTVINGTITAHNGYFKIDNLRPGSYIIKAGFIGYNDYKSPLIELTPSQPQLSFKVRLKTNDKSLKEVTVTGIKDPYTFGVDKKVYNVGSDVTTQGGSAIDVLQNVPSVSVDVQDNVNLRGSDNVTILIDGKPSSLLGTDPSTALQSIPANAIDKIEVITNPSAKYDATGTAGIINIVTKKSELNGLSGSVTTGASTSPRYSTGLNLNYRATKFNLYCSYDFVYNNRPGFGNIFQTNYYADSVSYLKENSSQQQINRTQVASTGFDFDINPLNTISYYASYNYFLQTEKQIIETDFYNSSDDATGGLLRNLGNPNNRDGWDNILSYKKTFLKPGEELTAYGQYSTMNSTGDINTFTDLTLTPNLTPANDTPSVQVNHSPEVKKEWTLQADYVLPVTKNNKLEAGLKWDDQTINHQYYAEQLNTVTNSFYLLPQLSDYFNYNEQVSATYADYTTSFHSINIKVGLRAENTYLTFDQLTINKNYIQDYTDLFPDIFFSKTITKTTEFQLSYSRRINRPDDRSLDPIPDYTDPQNIREGNPYLQPEFQNEIEFTVLHYISKGLLSLSLYYSQTNNTIQRYKTVDSLGIGTLTYINLNQSYNYGLEALIKNTFTNWLDVTASANAYGNQLNGNNLNSGIVTNDFIIYAKLILNVLFMKGFSGQVQGQYLSPQNTVFGHMNASGSLSIGIKKDIISKKLIAVLALNDVFNTQHYSLIFTGNNFVQDFYRKRLTRFLSLNLTYNFGRVDNSKQQKEQNLQNNQPEDY